MKKRLYVSPITEEIVEAAHIVEASHPKRIGFCASVGQVGPGAYTGFEYDVFCRARNAAMKRHDSTVILERDHLGRNGERFEEWVPRDIEHGFDAFMLHVFEPSAALPILHDYGYDVYEWQIGPGEDDSRPIDESLWDATAPFATWFSRPTGCLIQGLSNRGEFDPEVVSNRVAFRGHNCDYLPELKLREVQRWCNGINVAPQIGVVQSLWYYMWAVSSGTDVREWLDACWADQKNAARWAKSPYDMPWAVAHYHLDKLSPELRDGVRNTCTRMLVGYITYLLEG